jgi:hypothetical protein
VKVGDYVKIPGSCYRDEEAEAVGVVTRTDPDGIDRGTPGLHRIQVLWLQDLEYSWEPAKWLEVISESR